MVPSITFLGTGGDSFVVGRDIRSSGGFVLRIGDNQFHVDPGPGAVMNAAKYGIRLRENTAVLVSHNHLNHANDINAVISSMTYNGLDKKGVLVANKTVITGNEQYRPYLMSYYRDFLERFIALEAGQRVGINEIEIRALKAKHSDPNTIGFKFFTPQFTLAYSSDTEYFPEMIEEYKNSSVLVLNLVNSKKSKNNLCTDDVIKIISKVNPKLAILQHFGIELIKADPLSVTREIQKQTGIQVLAAKDGMVLNPISYAVQQGQRTLYAYPSKEEKKVEVREIRG